jgi:hypothetical protein
MSELTLTSHAAARMAQRGINIKDAERIAVIGTIVDDDISSAPKIAKRSNGSSRTFWSALGVFVESD